MGKQQVKQILWITTNKVHQSTTNKTIVMNYYEQSTTNKTNVVNYYDQNTK